MSFEIGERVGDYQVIDVLGAGGMGKVYKVRNVISDRVEAMKVLLPNLESDPELGDRFMREIKVQASLDHPNIAGLHTAQRIGNQLVMIMEFVEGSTVEADLHKGPLSIPLAVDYTRQVLAALSYAHARGIIHRDIKPANMMVTSQGVIKLMDFGIAKLTADPKLTQTGHTVGSLYYMSPEQINGAANLDPRSDLYSLGVSLYEMVTGKRPFLGDSDYSIMAAHLNSTPVPPVQIDPRMPAALNEIILMSIAKDPARRFQSADAFRAALGNVASSLGVPGGAMAASVPPLLTSQSQMPLNGGATPQMAETVPNNPPPPVKGNHRGLYMTVGSLVTIAVIAFAAIEGPKWFHSQGASSVPSQAQSQTQTAVPQNVPVPVPDSAQPSPVAQSAAETTAQPATNQTVSPEASTRAKTSITAGVQPSRLTNSVKASQGGPSAQNPPPSGSAASSTQRIDALPQPNASQTTSPQTRSAQPNPSQPSSAPESTAAIQDLRDRLMQMGIRAATVKKSIGALQAQQAQNGMTMRADITSSISRMEFQMDEAEGSLRAGDAAKGKRTLESAEREIEKLEKFLGH